MLMPGRSFPALDISLVEGGRWALREARQEMTLISVIRGHFCTYCHEGLVDLDRHWADFEAIGVDIVTTSTDDSATALRMAHELDLRRIRVGFGLDLSEIRRLELYATERGDAVFAEPAILIARRDGTVYAVFQNSVSCGRTDVGRLLEGLRLLAPHGFPLRGNA